MGHTQQGSYTSHSQAHPGHHSLCIPWRSPKGGALLPSFSSPVGLTNIPQGYEAARGTAVPTSIRMGARGFLSIPRILSSSEAAATTNRVLIIAQLEVWMQRADRHPPSAHTAAPPPPPFRVRKRPSYNHSGSLRYCVRLPRLPRGPQGPGPNTGTLALFWASLHLP